MPRNKLFSFTDHEHIKYIKLRLDGISLKFLQDCHGGVFDGKETDIEAIRYLLTLGVIENNVFPTQPKITYGYTLTFVGREILQGLKVGLYPIFIDELFLSKFAGNSYIKDNYDINIDLCIDIFFQYISQDYKNILKRRLGEDIKPFDYVYHFFDDMDYKEISSTIEEIKKADTIISKFL